MKTTFIFALTMLLVCGLFYSAQAAQEGNVCDGIQLTIAINANRFKVGDPVVITMEFRNVSDRQINFFFSKRPVEFMTLLITSEEGKELFRSKAANLVPTRPNVAEFKKMKPQDTYTDSLDLTAEIADIVPENGTYNIQITYNVPGHWTDLLEIGSDYWKGPVRSNDISFYAVKTYTVNEVDDATTKAKIEAKVRELFDNKEVEVTRIQELGDLGVFATHRLLRVFVNKKGLLEHTVGPNGPSYGMFAYDGETLLYLNRANNNLERVLREEGPQGARDIPVRELAEVVIMCMVNEGEVNNELISSVQDVYNYENKKGEFKGYVVHRGNLGAFSNVVASPRWEDSAKTRLVFYALSGWRHNLLNLNRITAFFDDENQEIKITKECLNSEIFKKMPRITYE